MEGDDLLQYNRCFNDLLYQTGWDRSEGAVKEYYMAGLIPFYWDKVATSLANQLPRTLDGWMTACENIYQTHKTINVLRGRSDDQVGLYRAPTQTTSRPKTQFRKFPPRRQILQRPEVKAPEVKSNPFITTNMVCFNCRRTGHMAKDCKQPKRERQRINMIDEQELLGMDDDELDEWWEEMQYYRAEAMTFQMLPSHEEQH